MLERILLNGHFVAAHIRIFLYPTEPDQTEDRVDKADDSHDDCHNNHHGFAHIREAAHGVFATRRRHILLHHLSNLT